MKGYKEIVPNYTYHEDTCYIQIIPNYTYPKGPKDECYNEIIPNYNYSKDTYKQFHGSH